MYAELMRRQAIVELLAMPDSPDLRRGYKITVEGRPDRYGQLPYLASVFVQAKLLELRELQSQREAAAATAAAAAAMAAATPANTDTVAARIAACAPRSWLWTQTQ